MIKRKTRPSFGNRSARAGLAAFALVLCAAPSVRAEEDCVDVQSSTADADFLSCDQDIAFDLDAALAQQAMPAQASASSDGMPWIALSKNTVPSKFNASDSSVSVRTSLGTLRDFNSRSVSVQKPEYATSEVYEVKLPKAAAAPTTPVDVWTNIDLNGYNERASDKTTRVGFGADYKISKKASVGLSLERADTRSSAASAQDQKAAAYVSLQAAPMLSLDARTEWETSAGSSGTAAGGSAFILAPKVNHSFALEGGTTLEPFVTYKKAFDLSTSHAADTSFETNSAGAGVTYSKPDAYTLSVTADVDNLGASSEPQSLSSKFQLSVPIR
ncbi:hypothetical protein [Hyphomicrobium sp.]|uniref:hypothetical protein n=1 Tax=Hyphomicrobium sp. TaxID=82 RepID=UPI002D799661|nr:hypothetical protein [Hyphomicrobium sp.]HET6388050.1 hypothetical protein [Hyphomicrobium sp.]